MEESQINVIVIDIDGTIANIDHRLHLIKQTPKDWAGFNDKAVDDVPLLENIETIKAALKELGAQPVFITGRSSVIREKTFDWITKHFFGEVTPYTLHMRAEGDFREDFEVKKEIHDNALVDCKVLRVYEDRPQVIRMWRELGYDVVDVGPGIEF